LYSPNRNRSVSSHDQSAPEMKGIGLSSLPEGVAGGSPYDESIDDGQVWKIMERDWRVGEKTLLMGVLNVTPDSFFDGNRYREKETALKRAYDMIEEGADIIDIGGESTRPGSKGVDAEEELKRTIPVITSLAKERPVPISIDTTKSEVATAALDAGAEIINDISAMRFDRKMAAVATQYGASVIIMHMRGIPETMQKETTYDNVLSEIYQFLSERISFLLKQGVERKRIAIDPGIGFGKGVRDNLKIVREIGSFKSLGQPIVLGPSRKSFIGKVLGLDVQDRLEGTAAAVTAGVLGGANIVRVHDVKEMKRVITMADAIRNA
jgi:dihydropteroate synthase